MMDLTQLQQQEGRDGAADASRAAARVGEGGGCQGAIKNKKKKTSGKECKEEWGGVLERHGQRTLRCP